MKRFPVDIIKIDRSFVRDVRRDADGDAIITATPSVQDKLFL